MKKIAFITLVFIILTQIFSCKHTNREHNLAKVDSLMVVLEKADNMLKTEINYDSVTFMFNELKNIEEAISPVLIKLTQKEKSDYMQLMSSEKHFKNLIASFDKYNEELEYSKKQLQNLKFDFENRIIKKEKFNEYLETEKKAVYSLLNSLKTEVYKNKKHFERFYYFNPIVEKIIVDKKLNKIKKSSNKETNTKINDNEEND